MGHPLQQSAHLSHCGHRLLDPKHPLHPSQRQQQSVHRSHPSLHTIEIPSTAPGHLLQSTQGVTRTRQHEALHPPHRSQTSACASPCCLHTSQLQPSSSVSFSPRLVMTCRNSAAEMKPKPMPSLSNTWAQQQFHRTAVLATSIATRKPRANTPQSDHASL